MATEGLLGGVNVVVLDAKLLASLPHNGCYTTVVRLDDPGEEVVGCLMVEGPCEHRPEPAVSRIVLCRCYLHLCPVSREVGGECNLLLCKERGS